MSVPSNHMEGICSIDQNGGSDFPCKIKKGLRGPVKLLLVDDGRHISRYIMQQV